MEEAKSAMRGRKVKKFLAFIHLYKDIFIPISNFALQLGVIYGFATSDFMLGNPRGAQRNITKNFNTRWTPEKPRSGLIRMIYMKYKTIIRSRNLYQRLEAPSLI